MTPREFLFGFLRQCAHAAAAFLVFLVALERLAPTSVLPYISPFAWGIVTLGLLLVAASPVVTHRFRGYAMIVPGLALAGWLVIILPNGAKWTWLLVAACLILAVSAAQFYSREQPTV